MTQCLLFRTYQSVQIMYRIAQLVVLWALASLTLRVINLWMMTCAAHERFCSSLNMQLPKFIAQFCQGGAKLENRTQYFAWKVKYLLDSEERGSRFSFLLCKTVIVIYHCIRPPASRSSYADSATRFAASRFQTEPEPYLNICS